MDFAALTVTPIDDRLRFELRLHELAAARLLKTDTQELARKDLAKFSRPLFSAILESASVRLDGKACVWARPDLLPNEGDEHFIKLKVAAICSNSKPEPFFMQLDLPSLKESPREFQVLVKVEGVPSALSTTVMNSTLTNIEIGSKEATGIGGFIKMGMAHIGATPGEWRGKGGNFQIAEGIDHICFLLAIIFANVRLIELLKSITGFSLGHSLTLGLSAFKIIHIHSKWVEVAIAFSIVYSAWASLYKTKSQHRLALPALFGTVHGLGFASAIQELQLSNAETWRALIGFNLGIEFGQLLIVAAISPVLFILARHAPGVYDWLRRAGSFLLLIVGGSWFLLRFMGAMAPP